MFKYNLPKSTIYRLKRQYFNKNKDSSKILNLFEDIFGINKEELKGLIKFVTPIKIPLTIQKIQEHLNSKFNSKISYKAILKYLKHCLNYSFKKGPSTTFKGGSDIIYFQKIIYSCRILTDIFNKKYIVNIDESSF